MSHPIHVFCSDKFLTVFYIYSVAVCYSPLLNTIASSNYADYLFDTACHAVLMCDDYP